MNYETSRTVKRIRMPQGIVHRMSVSVIVDQDVRWQTVGKGKQAHLQRFIDAPSADRMKTIKDVIAAAVGVNATRGDQLTVETLPFEATLTADPPGSMQPGAHPAPGSKFSPAVLGGIGGGVLLLAALGFFLFKKKKKDAAHLAELQKQLAAARATPVGHPSSLHSSDDKSSLAPSLENLAEAFKLPAGGTTKAEVLTRQVNEQAHKDPAALAQIVRTWLNEPVNSK